MVSQLPLPRLEARALDPLHIVTDDALARETGVRVVFTGRKGGLSTGDYRGLNLAGHVGDDPSSVEENRALLMRVLAAPDVPVVVPNQVHGDNLVVIENSSTRGRVAELARVRAICAEGADGIVCHAPDVAPLLCFADCVPVVVVSPSGSFAVVHAGWRGVIASIASKAVLRLVEHDRSVARLTSLPVEDIAGSYNVYIGPHIHGECFECGEDLIRRFVDQFGEACSRDPRHVDLAEALRIDLVRVGVDGSRIADAGACTMCHPDQYYSYRAEGGTCGRHGALAFRRS